MTSKKIVRKKGAKKVAPPRVVPNAELDPPANARALQEKETPTEPAKIHAKSVHVIFSVGTDDRDRSVEDFIEDIRKKVKPVPYDEYVEDGKRRAGVHMTVTSEQYILDGKVCLPVDYDPDTQNFKDGSYPPSWAGGPSHRDLEIKKKLQEDLAEMTEDDYDRKYGIGKYEKKPDMSRLITPEMQRVARERSRLDKMQREDDELEEIDWDEVEEAADESTAAAVKKMKRVVKKPKPQPKKIVRIKK